ncbi:hypothetical protein G6F35_012270 [Rhizopus arrhizus]|nr:hypothetical protein G6F35_012270 [Rhizopus arrhizus]
MTPGSMNGLGTFHYWLGTDGQGRDLLSGILYGLRISLMVGVGSAVIAGIVGTLLGLLAAYAGGKVDAIIMRLVDLILSFPSILVAMMILAYLGKGVGNVVLTLVILEWAYYARTARGQALVERRREYVEAARCLDIPNWRIMLKHILPNCLPPLIVIGTLQIARAITLEATLSFLGLGVPFLPRHRAVDHHRRHQPGGRPPARRAEPEDPQMTDRTATGAPATLEVRNLRTHFHTRAGVLPAVDDVSFTLERGKILGLVGESGSGKSVTGFSIMGLVDAPGRIVGGEVLFQGRDLTKLTR